MCWPASRPSALRCAGGRRRLRREADHKIDYDASSLELADQRPGTGHAPPWLRAPAALHLLRPVPAAKLRPANIDGAAGAVDEVARIVARIRARWPGSCCAAIRAPEPETPEQRIVQTLADAETPLSQRQIRERAGDRMAYDHCSPRTSSATMQANQLRLWKLIREHRVECAPGGGYRLVAVAPASTARTRYRKPLPPPEPLGRARR